MPAAIRIDIDLKAVQNSDEFPTAAKASVRELAHKLSAAAQATLTEFFDIKPQEGPVLSEPHVVEGIPGVPDYPEGTFQVSIRCNLG